MGNSDLCSRGKRGEVGELKFSFFLPKEQRITRMMVRKFTPLAREASPWEGNNQNHPLIFQRVGTQILNKPTDFSEPDVPIFLLLKSP